MSLGCAIIMLTFITIIVALASELLTGSIEEVGVSLAWTCGSLQLAFGGLVESKLVSNCVCTVCLGPQLNLTNVFMTPAPQCRLHTMHSCTCTLL